MKNTLNALNDWIVQSKQRLTKFRDDLRMEARNAP